MNIAIIPARYGSKRIPEKNIKLFHGKPIIAYSILAAKQSNLFEHIIVSTDSKKIAEIATHYGAKVPFLRSEQNSNDTATTMDVLKETCESLDKRYEYDFNNTCCIYPTAPFLTSKVLIESFEVFKNGDFTSLIPVTEYEFPIFRSVKIDTDRTLKWLYPEFANSRSQDLQVAYHDVGQFYWMKKDFIYSCSNILEGRPGSYLIKPTTVQDIDNIDDWKMAEIKYEIMLKNTDK